MSPAPPRLRDATARDLPEIHRLSQAVGWPHREADLRLLLALGHGFAAIGPGGVVEGCAAWWPFGDAVATVGLVIVRPDLQGRGLGGALFRAALDGAGPRRLHLHATQAGRPLYERHGFAANGLVHQHQGIVRAGPGGSGAGVRAIRADDRAAILALDRAATEADRTRLLDELVGTARGFVRCEAGRTTGFAFLRAFGRGQVLGPVIAEDDAGAAALTEAGMDAAEGGFLRMDVPAAAGPLRNRLAAAGLAEVATALPMVRGGLGAPTGPARIYGLAAQALG